MTANRERRKGNAVYAERTTQKAIAAPDCDELTGAGCGSDSRRVQPEETDAGR
ncbi:MAG: hypothetical protein ACOC6A_03755 [Chloroflexota bacterium]